MAMTRKKPPAPSVPKPKDKLDPNRWKKAALDLAGPTTIRHKRLMQMYIARATPEQAAEEAKTHHADTRGGPLRRGR
jgi:hypothetical protein